MNGNEILRDRHGNKLGEVRDTWFHKHPARQTRRQARPV